MIRRRKIESEAEWLAWRREFVTASDVAAMFGLHPYKTALELWAEKSGLDLGQKKETAAMRRGRILEPAVAVAVRYERPNWKIAEAREFYSDDAAGLGASPDFEVRDFARMRRKAPTRILLQAKTVSPAMFEREWSEDAPPFWIVLQNACELMLAECQHGAVAALIIDPWRLDVAIYEIERHADAERKIRDKAAWFWDCVKTGKQPPPDFNRDGDVLAALYPRERLEYPDVDMNANDRVRELLAMRRGLIGQKRSIGEALGRVNTELKSIVADAQSAYGQGWRVRWKTVERAPSYDPGGSERRLIVTDHTGKTESVDGNEDQNGRQDRGTRSDVGF